jgi:Fe-S-cluster containining protein
LAVVPKLFHSDLSPETLEFVQSRYREERVQRYLKLNAAEIENPCRWLRREENGKYTCIVYARRSSSCREYPDSEVCKVGKYKTKGGTIYDEC